MQWAEHLAREPRGFIVEDARHSVLLATIARAAGVKGAKPADFSMGQLGELEAAPAPDEREKFDRMVGIIDRAEAAASRPRRKGK